MPPGQRRTKVHPIPKHCTCSALLNGSSSLPVLSREEDPGLPSGRGRKTPGFTELDSEKSSRTNQHNKLGFLRTPLNHFRPVRVQVDPEADSLGFPYTGKPEGHQFPMSHKSPQGMNPATRFLLRGYY